MVIQMKEIASKLAEDSTGGTVFRLLELGIYWAVQMRNYGDIYTAYFTDEEEAKQVYDDINSISEGYDLE